MKPFEDNKLNGAVLIVESREGNFECDLPFDTFQKYNNILTLNMKTESLIAGQFPLRVPILIALRVLLTLLIEGAIFILFGYRQKRSWLAFFIINILTQTGLNAMITGPGIGSYWMLGFIFLETIILIVEIIAFINILKEHKRGRAAIYAVAANLASLILGGLLITYLPV